MSKFIIQGKQKLSGEVTVSGNKNSMFPLMAASLLGSSPTTLTNVPTIRDVDVLSDIIRDLGGTVQNDREGNLIIDAESVTSHILDPELAGKIRGSIVLAAPLLVKFKKTEFPRPGGDSIGERPLNANLMALEGYGARVTKEPNRYLIEADSLHTADIFFDEASVTATEMALIVGASIEGESKIEGAACEPHVVDLAEMLVKMGVKIQGAGTNTIIVSGNPNLVGVEHRVRPEHIEVGTYAIAAAITHGEIIIHDAYPQDLKIILSFLSKMGVEYEFVGKTDLKIKKSHLVPKQRTFKTRTWPGFPTDLVSPLIVLASQAEGTVLVHDWMYETRMFFVDYLVKMGANIVLADPHRVIITGPSKLYGETIPSPDIRAGVALVLAALVAEGQSTVEHAEIIDRGYEKFEQKLQALGVDIRREE